MKFVNILVDFMKEVRKMGTTLKKEVAVILAVKGKNQAWLAEKLDINEGYLSRILNGKDKPKKQIEKIRKFLDEG